MEATDKETDILHRDMLLLGDPDTVPCRMGYVVF